MYVRFSEQSDNPFRSISAFEEGQFQLRQQSLHTFMISREAGYFTHYDAGMFPWEPSSEDTLKTRINAFTELSASTPAAIWEPQYLSFIEYFAREGGPALVIAAKSGAFQVLKDLLMAGVPVDAQDTYGKTALMYASQEKNKKMMEYLLSSGANINATASVMGKTMSPIDFAVLNCDASEAHIMRWFIENGAMVERARKTGRNVVDFLTQHDPSTLRRLNIQEDMDEDMDLADEAPDSGIVTISGQTPDETRRYQLKRPFSMV